MAWAEATVREAEAVGAANVPSANDQLERAKNEVRLAKLLSAREDNERAESMLRRAAADAQLAAALTREAQAHEQVLSQASPTNGKEVAP
jgi:hypothetical protein